MRRLHIRSARGAASLLALLALTGFARSAPAAKPVRVLAIVSQEAGPYQEALAGFRSAIAAAGGGAIVEVVTVEGDPARAAAAVQAARQEGVALILSLGSLPTRAAMEGAKGTPVVAGLVLRENEIQREANATGVVLEFPVETEIRYLQRMLPQLRTIGVLYGSPEAAARVEAAKRIVPGLGLKLHAERLESRRDLPDALERLAREADALWGVADEMVFSPQLAKPILLFSMRNRIPLVGLSESWVKAGALYALDRDYADIGAQCADQAIRILRGAAPRSLPPATPRRTVHFVNAKAARQMRMDLKGPLLSEARSVIE
jgi:putative ABC transport system substrate-binding protein